MKKSSVWAFTLGAAIVGLTGATAASAAEIVYHGSILITSAVGCDDGWNPVGHVKDATYWLPIAGSSNGNKSVITLREGDGAEGFAYYDGRFGSSFKTVEATHVGTLTGTYSASLKVTSQTPAIPTSSTVFVRVIGAIKGFDFRPACTITFDMAAYKVVN